MAQRGSQHPEDELVWSTAGVRLGQTGLDLRLPADPGALTKLLNARFQDDRTIRQREGHRGFALRDSADFPALGVSYTVTDEWVYGHGARVSSTNALSWENAHHPFPGRAEATFTYEGDEVVWTGDRLLYTRGDAPALGSSAFWNRGLSSTPASKGIPAYLPLQTDSNPPASVTGEYVETCLTSRYRAFAQSDVSSGTLNAWIVDRETGATIDASEISGASNAPCEVKVLNSDDLVVVLWRDYTSKVLYINHWTGSVWSGASVLHADVYAYDVAPVQGGFHLLWREGTPLTAALYVTRFARASSQSTPYPTRTQLTGITPDGPLAIGVSPVGDLGVLASSSSGLQARLYSSTTDVRSAWTVVSGSTGWVAGLSIASRGLRESGGYYRWVVHASRGSSLGTLIAGLGAAPTTGSAIPVETSSTRYNSCLASKSWRVGDEVFCWLRSSNAGTHYLVAGVGSIQICGYADREEAITRTLRENNYGIPHVLPDPNDTRGLTFTWARPFNTGQTYSHSGNVRVGDIDHLPEMTPVQFGRSVYLSGSAVRNYDGVELGDAGFQDYPVVTAATPGSSGALLTTGDYYFRVYPVRYNKRGERFQGAAVTYGPVKLTGGQTSVALSIATLPSTNHSDVMFEVYRTEAGGTTFYLDGVVSNDLTTGSVTFTSTRADLSTPIAATDLISQVGDPHAAGVGALSELEEFGPLGCSMLAVSGDRLWGAGGQVPAGLVQFSKLKEDGEGAGFDELAGFQMIDTEGHPITSVAALNDVTVVFQASRLNIIAGTGPDNYGRGAFTIPQIVLADGAVTHRGTLLSQLGLLFWGADGPRLLTTDLAVKLISAPVRPLAETLEPSGVRVSLSRHEVVWYTRTGEALLWNYLGENSRWAQWSGLFIAGCSDSALVTTSGQLLYEDPEAVGDAGQGFAFTWATGNLRPEQILAGFTVLRAIGVNGVFEGKHRLRVRVYYNGSPLWAEQWVWSPEDETWLTVCNDLAGLTPAEIDALPTTDRSGGYNTHKRVSRQGCQFFRVEVSTIESDHPTYIPYELSLELGARGGLGRVPVNTFATSIGG